MIKVSDKKHNVPITQAEGDFYPSSKPVLHIAAEHVHLIPLISDSILQANRCIRRQKS